MSAQVNPVEKQFVASEIFPVPFKHPLTGFDRPWDTPTLKTPKALATYVWDSALIHTMVMFWFSGETSLKLIGHTGTGKTEAVMNFHAALNLPLIMLTANPQLASRDLIGGFFPAPGGPVWRDGPITVAARLGLSLLIDEYNLLDPGEATGLNAFLEGRQFTVPETGETITPVQGFRVFVTINPKSAGYNGRQTQDLANDDRFVDAHTKYPERDVEVAAVSNYLVTATRTPQPEATNIADAVVAGATAIRAAYMGENDNANALPCTMSMRGTMRFAKWTVMFSRIYQATAPESPLYMALDVVLANRQRPEVRQAVREAFRLATGIEPTPTTT